MKVSAKLYAPVIFPMVHIEQNVGWSGKDVQQDRKIPSTARNRMQDCQAYGLLAIPTTLHRFLREKHILQEFLKS
jgi:hypothetical protein